MKWFKHQTENNSFIFKLVELFGGDGYLIYYRTREMIAEEFDIKNPGKAQFSVKKMTNFIQVSAGKLRKVLNFLTKSEQIFAEFIDNGVPSINLYDPELQELTDEYTTKKIGTVSGQTPDNVRKKSPQIRLDKIRTDKNRLDKSTVSDKSDHHKFVSFFTKSYKKEFKVAYGFDGGKDAALVKTLLSQFGYELLCQMTVRFFKCQDDFIRYKVGYTIAGLKLRSNQLAREVGGNKTVLDKMSESGRQSAINTLKWLNRSSNDQ